MIYQNYETYFKENKINLYENFINNKKKYLQEFQISPTQINLFLDSRAKFILSYLFGLKFSNYRVHFGKKVERNLINSLIARESVFEENFDDIEFIKNDKYEILIDNQENFDSEVKDYLKTKDVLKNLSVFLNNNYEYINSNQSLEYSFSKKLIKFVPDLILKNTNGEYVLCEIKYTKRIPSEESPNYSHIRQLLFYDILLKKMKHKNITKLMLIYISPKKTSIKKIFNTDLNFNYINTIIKYFKKFIKSINYDEAIFIIKNEINNYYFDDLHKYICTNSLINNNSIYFSTKIENEIEI